MEFTPDKITRIILRNDTSDNWEKVSGTAVLLAGEIGIEFTKDENEDKKAIIKVGDGERTWGELPYISGNPSDLNDILDKIEANKKNIDKILETDLSNLSDQVATNKESIEDLQKLLGEEGTNFSQLQETVRQQNDKITTLNNLGLSVENGSICLTYKETV